MARPNSLGLFLCNHVIVERNTESRTIVGIFDEVTCSSFPARLPAFEVYAELTDGQGRVTLDLVITNLAEDEELVVRTWNIELANPLSIFHFCARSRNISIPVAGQYLIELLADDVPICHRRLHVHNEGA